MSTIVVSGYYKLKIGNALTDELCWWHEREAKPALRLCETVLRIEENESQGTA